MFNFSTLPFGLTVTGIGILIVFFGLVILIGLIKIMQIATGGMGKKEKKAPKAKAPEVSKPAAPAASDEDAQMAAVIAAAIAAAEDEQLIAVISAAVAAVTSEDGRSFVVRRVRRISNAPAWTKAGREEQIYSRF